MYQERRREQVGDRGPERSPLLSQKDDDLSSWGSSSYVSGSDDESLEDAWDGKHVKDGEHNSLLRLCATCFDAPRDCFFLPCAHCVACSGCATRIADASGTCPICRRCIKKGKKAIHSLSPPASCFDCDLVEIVSSLIDRVEWLYRFQLQIILENFTCKCNSLPDIIH